MIPRCRSRLVAIAFLGILGCSSGDGLKSPTDPDDPGDPPEGQLPATTNTVTIQPSGGSVSLKDGTSVVFPPGAVSAPLAVTITRLQPSAFFDGSGEQQQAVIRTTAALTQFAQNVEIRVPLPEGMTLADSSKVLAGVIDDETGGVVAESPVIRMLDGKPFLVVETDHFTTRLYEWVFGKTPPNSALLDLPYYTQGESEYCWAASLQMVTQGASFAENRSITDIIGAVGVDPSGITALGFFSNSDIAQVVRSRTGVRPTRRQFSNASHNQLRDYLRMEIGVNGRPVALHNGNWQHAVVVVGYEVDPSGSFMDSKVRIHDPKGLTPGSIGYTTKIWSDLVGTTFDRLTTLVVPTPLPGGSDRVTANFTNGAFQFFKPRYGPDDPPNTWAFEWDHTKPEGFAFHEPDGPLSVDPLPGEVDIFRVMGAIQIANASRTVSKEVGVYLTILAMGAPAGEGRLSTYKSMTLGPNSAKNLPVPEFAVDTFRYNTAQTTEYAMTADVTVGGVTVDRQTVRFRIGSVTPVVTSVLPAAASVGDQVTIRGSKLGTMAFHNAVEFNGEAATTVVSWRDDQIVVVVPEGATTGPLLVKRGEMESNEVDFTVAEFTTLSGDVAVSYAETVIDGINIDVAGTWSLTGEGAAIDYVYPATNHHVFLVKPGVPAQLSLDFSGTLAPGTKAYPGGGSMVFHPIEWDFLTTNEGTVQVDAAGSDGNMTFNITLGGWGDMFCANPQFKIYADWFNQEGALISEHTYINGRTPALFCVKPIG